MNGTWEPSHERQAGFFSAHMARQIVAEMLCARRIRPRTGERRWMRLSRDALIERARETVRIEREPSRGWLLIRETKARDVVKDGIASRIECVCA